jgi:hypothetical protein
VEIVIRARKTREIPRQIHQNPSLVATKTSNYFKPPVLTGCGTLNKAKFKAEVLASVTSSICSLLVLVDIPISIWGGSDCAGSLSVVVFQALSSPVSAKTNLLLARRFNMLCGASN